MSNEGNPNMERAADAPAAKGASSIPGSTEEQFLKDPATPRWIKDVFRFLSVKSQFVLSGNIRDIYPFPRSPGKYVPLPLVQYMAEALKLKGYEFFVSFRSTDGFSVVMPGGGVEKTTKDFFKDQLKFSFDERGRIPCSLEKSWEMIRRATDCKGNFVAVFADFASRYSIRVDSLSEKENDYFTQALVISHETAPHVTPSVPQAQFNPVFWLCDKENDLPNWFTLNNPKIRCVTIPKPDHIIRNALIEAVAPSLDGYLAANEKQARDCRAIFVEQTEGMTMTDVIAITQLCRREKLKFQEVGEAVRRYKLGVTEDPWKRINREKISMGEEIIKKRVKGQQQAVVKALDIVKRAITGLSGAQGSRIGGKPRGVMFLAGPTGTGKTELAKTLTELLFGDQNAYIRFDMSEFSAEHAADRLIGAPPGYVGMDMGGELTNAIKEKPFSVVLFDEIEKAAPKILDKFLQILDDGVLTSGRGERVYFSESVIIFTSNLGIYKTSDDGQRVQQVSADEPYTEIERKVRSEIEAYFKLQLGRPEILNRIGENIVVFDFIRPEIALQILNKMVANVLDHLAEKQKIRITFTDAVKESLQRACLRDLSNGGRGVGNQLEAWFINPLGRALFDQNITEGSSITVTAVNLVDGVPTVTVTVNPDAKQEP